MSEEDRIEEAHSRIDRLIEANINLNEEVKNLKHRLVVNGMPLQQVYVNGEVGILNLSTIYGGGGFEVRQITILWIETYY